MIEMIVRFDNIQILKPFNSNNKTLQSERSTPWTAEKIFIVHTVDRGLTDKKENPKNTYKSVEKSKECPKRKCQRIHSIHVKEIRIAIKVT